MTKRELFAGLALQGLLSGGVPIEPRTASNVAAAAVAQADALIAALNETPK